MSRVDPAVIANDPQRRTVMVELLDAALAAVDPGLVTARALRSADGRLDIGRASVDLGDIERVVILGLGKAAPDMAAAACEALADLSPTGVVVGAAHVSAPLPSGLDVMVGDHPVPGEASLAAGEALLAAAAEATEDDLVIVLVSGGGSALAELPVDGVELPDLARVTDDLLGRAVPIEQINALRARLSRIKGGGLGAAAGRARLVTLVLSDVVGNPLHVVASGPTLVPPTSEDIAADIIESLPAAARRAVDRYLPRPRHDRHSAVLVGDATTAATAVVGAAAGHGVEAEIADSPLRGVASRAGRRVVEEAVGPGMNVYVGETVVDVVGSGVGGRNQEVALAAALAAEGDPDLVVATLATDGVDGPTPAAGAIVDGQTVDRVGRSGFDAAAALANNDSFTVLGPAGDLVVTGPTGTNVADLTVVWRR